MNDENLKDVKHPICPMSMYFEGDEDKCDTSKCDWNEDGVRSCSQACKVLYSVNNKLLDEFLALMIGPIFLVDKEKKVSCSGCLKVIPDVYFVFEDEVYCRKCARDLLDDSSPGAEGAFFRRREKAKDEKLLNDDKAILPGSGISFHQFKEPDARILKTFDSPEKEVPFNITISTNELTALCPLTSMPDYYTLEIRYVPAEKCIESKSAKFYFHSFRDAGMFIEALTNKIADDWVKACNPKFLKVKNTMNARGGIPITVVVERGAPLC